MYRSAYLVGNMLLLVIWLILFFKRKDLRKEQLFVSTLTAVFAPITDYLIFFKDYWRPDYLLTLNVNGVRLGIESPLFGFLLGGITAVLYEAFFRKRHLFSKPRNFLGPVMFISIILGMILLTHLGLNSIWASSISLILGSITMVLIDKDIIRDAIWSCILFITIVFPVYSFWFFLYPEALERFWMNLSGLKFGLIPIEEFVWFFCAGSTLGILYEFWRNVRKYPQQKEVR